jgi:hypothetical protein
LRSGWSIWLLWLATVLVWGAFFFYAESLFRRSRRKAAD